MKKSNKAMVIDASVARSAGTREHPVSKRAREFLHVFMASDNSVVTTPDIQAEWKKHQTILAQKWLATMIAKKRRVHLNNVTQPNLRDQLTLACGEPDKLAAMEKDLLLVEAAVATDQCVISCDNKVRRYFGEMCEHIPLFQEVLWVNPILEEESACEWILEGAKLEKHRMIGFAKN